MPAKCMSRGSRPQNKTILSIRSCGLPPVPFEPVSIKALFADLAAIYAGILRMRPAAQLAGFLLLISHG